MAKFVSIPTQVTGQPNILFNTDNITTILPPTPGLTTGAGLYAKILSEDKEFQIAFGGVDGAAKNANSIAGAAIINNAITSANAAPLNYPVVFPSVTMVAGAGATGQTTITVASTAGLSVGMIVTVVSGSGAFATNTTVATINSNGTQFTVSAAPTTTLAGATISAAVLTVTGITVA